MSILSRFQGLGLLGGGHCVLRAVECHSSCPPTFVAPLALQLLLGLVTFKRLKSIFILPKPIFQTQQDLEKSSSLSIITGSCPFCLPVHSLFVFSPATSHHSPPQVIHTHPSTSVQCVCVCLLPTPTPRVQALLRRIISGVQAFLQVGQVALPSLYLSIVDWETAMLSRQDVLQSLYLAQPPVS